MSGKKTGKKNWNTVLGRTGAKALLEDVGAHKRHSVVPDKKRKESKKACRKKITGPLP